MQIAWTVDASLRPYAGHGIDFFSDESRAEGTLVAVIRGFEWLSGMTGETEALIRPADERYGVEFLARARLDIEQMLSAGGPMPD